MLLSLKLTFIIMHMILLKVSPYRSCGIKNTFSQASLGNLQCCELNPTVNEELYIFCLKLTVWPHMYHCSSLYMFQNGIGYGPSHQRWDCIAYKCILRNFRLPFVTSCLAFPLKYK